MENTTKQWSFNINDMPARFTEFEEEVVRKLYLRSVSEFLFSHTMTEDKLKLAFDSALFAVRTFKKIAKIERNKQQEFISSIPKQEWDEYIRLEEEAEFKTLMGDRYVPREK